MVNAPDFSPLIPLPELLFCVQKAQPKIESMKLFFEMSQQKT